MEGLPLDLDKKVYGVAGEIAVGPYPVVDADRGLAVTNHADTVRGSQDVTHLLQFRA